MKNKLNNLILLILWLFTAFMMLGCSSKPSWNHENDHSYKHVDSWHSNEADR